MRRLGAMAFVLAVLSGCNAAVSPGSAMPGPSSQAPSSSPASSAPVATPEATPAPTPTAAPVATAAALPSGVAWKELAGVADGAGPAGILVFKGRYVAWGHDAQSLPWVWTSSTGEQWQGTQLGRMITPCPGASEDYEAQVYAGATNGDQVVLVGLEYAQDAPTCGTHRAASWVSDDGDTWRRGNGFGGDGPFADSKNVWATPAGWEALTWAGGESPRGIWSSADGLTWKLAETVAVADPIEAGITGASDGTRVMVLTNSADGSADEVLGLRGGESRLRWSANGGSWKDVAFDFNAAGPVRLRVAVEANPATGGAWIVLGERSGDAADVWRSTDLVTWEHGRLPKPWVSTFGWTRYGYLATALNVGCGDGGECPPNPAQQFVSPDGMQWTQLPFAIEADVFVDGPAGLLAIDGNATVWRLE